MSKLNKYIEGIGRRKTATARVRIYQGKGANVVNERPIDEYFPVQDQLDIALKPFKITNMEKKYYLSAKVSGGGVVGHAGAISLGLARALVKLDKDLKPSLKAEDLMTRDPRMVERKKYHHRKSRKKPQFSKR